MSTIDMDQFQGQFDAIFQDPQHGPAPVRSREEFRGANYDKYLQGFQQGISKRESKEKGHVRSI